MTKHRAEQYTRTIRRLRQKHIFGEKEDQAVRIIDTMKQRLNPQWQAQHRQRKEKDLNNWMAIQ